MTPAEVSEKSTRLLKIMQADTEFGCMNGPSLVAILNTASTAMEQATIAQTTVAALKDALSRLGQ